MTNLPNHFADDHADLFDRARLLLAAQSVPAFRQISIEALHGRVTLRGVLQSYYHRQLAVALVRRIAGVTHVIDELAVSLPHTDAFIAASA
jgi:hypothetical protein